MMNNITIDQLAEAIAERVRPVIPLSVALWDYKLIGAYLNKSPQQVRQRYAPLPGFPQPYRLPSGGKERSHPLYKASEIIEWAEKYQERRAA